MIPLNRVPTHPGEILLAEFLEPLNLTPANFARHVDVPLQRINEIIRGKQAVTPEIAWLFAQAFKTSPEFWLNLQQYHDLALYRPSRHIEPLLQAT